MLHELIKSCDFDPFYNYTVADRINPFYLICLATGDGRELLRLIDIFKPYSLFLAFEDWNDFVTSFWVIDWQLLASQYDDPAGTRLFCGRFEEPIQLVSRMKENVLLE